MPAPPAGPRLPSTFTDRFGRVLVVDYPDRFVRQPPKSAAAEQQPPAGTGGAPAVAADGWGEDSNGDGDFVAPASSAGDPAVPDHPQQASMPAATLAGPRLPSTFTDRFGRVLAVDYPDRFVRQPPRSAAAEQQPSAGAGGTPAAADGTLAAGAPGAWEDGAEDEGNFADFCAAAPEGQAEQQPAEELGAELAACAAALEDASQAEQGMHAQDAPQEAQQQQQQQQQSQQASSGSTHRPSALLSALHPVSPRGSDGASHVSDRPSGQQGGWQGPGLALGPAAGFAAAAPTDVELVTEYAIAWARLLQVRPSPSKEHHACSVRQHTWQQQTAVRACAPPPPPPPRLLVPPSTHRRLHSRPVHEATAAVPHRSGLLCRQQRSSSATLPYFGKQRASRGAGTSWQRCPRRSSTWRPVRSSTPPPLLSGAVAVGLALAWCTPAARSLLLLAARPAGRDAS